MPCYNTAIIYETLCKNPIKKGKIIMQKNMFVIRLSKILTKICEIVHWVGVACMVLLLVLGIFFPDLLPQYIVASEQGDTTAEYYGFEINVYSAQGSFQPGALIILAIFGIIALSLMAIVFRNLYLIVKSIGSETDNSPFSKDNVRRVREIGIFAIAIPVVGQIMQIAAFIVLGAENVEISLALDGYMMGLLALVLTQIFAYGARLEADVEGLL